ncbi:MAG: hypothetical protein IJ676_05910, partial [Clostridia bacterium]|nr:hypothetical protein [Clostridia bacterium]
MEQNAITLKEIFSLLRTEAGKGIELLYRFFYNKIYGIAFSIVKDEAKSEDVVQNVVYKIMKMDKSKFPTEYELSWLYTVTKNEAISFLRKEKQNVPLEYVENISEKKNCIDDY